MKKTYLLLVNLIIAISSYAGTYSASLGYEHINGLDYKFNLTIYTDTINVDSIIVIKVDNDTDTLYKKSQLLLNGLTIVKYQGIHSFFNTGTHYVIVELNNRLADINNIPNSISSELTIKTYININPFVGINNSPNDSILLIDTAIVNQVLSTNLSSYDIDGDSLSYKLKPCRGANGNSIPGYTFPAQPPVFSLDSISGILTWNTPLYQGEYSVLIQVEEWRSGTLISYTEREHFIVVNLGSGINNTENKLSNKVEVYPNPSSDIVNIRLKNSKEKIFEIEVFDIFGKQIIVKSNIRTPSSIIDVSSYEKGVYFYKIISSNKEVYSGKIIVY